jgi:predicted TIM-barrel enzyme
MTSDILTVVAVKITVTNVINALPDNSSVNAVQHARTGEADFCRYDRHTNRLAV